MFGRELDVDHLAYGQPCGVDPNFAAAGHVHIGAHWREIGFVGQFPLASQVFFHLAAHILGIFYPIQVEGIAGEGGEVGGR